MNAYDIGDSVRFTATFTTSASTPIDPTTITLRTSNNGGLGTASYVYGAAPEMTKMNTGIYRADLTMDAEKVWFVRWEGTGVCIAAAENKIWVRVSDVV
jgi:hypothetical protein